MNKDQIKGRIKEMKGKIKEVASKLGGDKNLEEKGKIQTSIGNVQAGYGDLKSDLKKDLKKGGRTQLCMLDRHEQLRGFT